VAEPYAFDTSPAPHAVPGGTRWAIFRYPGGFTIRAFMDDKGEAFFVVVDLVKAAGLKLESYEPTRILFGEDCAPKVHPPGEPGNKYIAAMNEGATFYMLARKPPPGPVKTLMVWLASKAIPELRRAYADKLRKQFGQS
jgi:hypothetical protein